MTAYGSSLHLRDLILKAYGEASATSDRESPHFIMVTVFDVTQTEQVEVGGA